MVMQRCNWANNELLINYHDNEYSNMDVELFELLTLEIFQPGLSFYIVLKKREALKLYFHNYDINKISKMNEDDILLGLDNSDIIRHRQKIEAIINNARLIKEKNIDLKVYLFDNIDYTSGVMDTGTKLSKKMKKDGFKFVGVSVVTSLLEAIGLLPAHSKMCYKYNGYKKTYQYMTPFGCMDLIYENFEIISSTIDTFKVVDNQVEINSFEILLKYHLDNYFINHKDTFSFYLRLDCTDFQKKVFASISNIEYGTTQTYGDVAILNDTMAFRAVGMAASKCNHMIFIPAHRLVAKNGIGGFQGNIKLKEDLLAHEQK